MTLDIRRLNAEQLDVLRELANMGAGHAATALSELTSRAIGMDVPEVSVVPTADVAGVLGEADGPLTAVLMDVRGNINARIVQVLPGRTAERLTSIVLGELEVVFPAGFGERHYDALEEIGEVVVGAYLNAVSVLLGQPLMPSPPNLRTGMTDGLLSSLLLEQEGAGGWVVCVNARLLIGDERLPAHVLLIPDDGAIAIMLHVLKWPT